MMKSFIPRAAPYVISPIAAALASLVRAVGTPIFSSNKAAKGITPLQGKLGANSMVPL